MTFIEELTLVLVDKLVIGVLLVAVGLWASRHLEIFKSSEARRSEAVTARITTIDRQLSEFYWPIVFRLEKDNAVWDRLMDPDKKLADQIEQQVILSNHKEILDIFDSHFALIFNPWEFSDPTLIDAIKQYERHTALYFALRAIGDVRMPIDLKEPWPDRIYPLLVERIRQLQAQRTEILVQ